MGVTIKCQATGRSCDLGYVGFNRLRIKTAELCCPEFGNHYKKLDSLKTDEEFSKFDAKTDELLARKAVDIKLVDFCLQSDCEGRVNYKTCQRIYNGIKDYDDNICYGYIGRPDCTMFRDFLAILKDCCDTKSSLVWS